MIAFCFVYPGITDQNREDVLWCVETSELEKSVRSAARGLFQTIASQTEATSEISRELFMKSIDKVAATKAEISLLKNAGNSNVIRYKFRISNHLTLHTGVIHKVERTREKMGVM